MIPYKLKYFKMMSLKSNVQVNSKPIYCDKKTIQIFSHVMCSLHTKIPFSGRRQSCYHFQLCQYCFYTLSGMTKDMKVVKCITKLKKDSNYITIKLYILHLSPKIDKNSVDKVGIDNVIAAFL